MKKLMTSKHALALGGVLASVAALAEGEQGAQSISAELVTSYITTGHTQIVTVLGAGAAIVGAFFIWGLIKRALNRSK